jgi:hypothetical protein
MTSTSTSKGEETTRKTIKHMKNNPGVASKVCVVTLFLAPDVQNFKKALYLLLIFGQFVRLGDGKWCRVRWLPDVRHAPQWSRFSTVDEDCTSDTRTDSHLGQCSRIVRARWLYMDVASVFPSFVIL